MPAPIPDDTKAALTRAKKTHEYVVTGNTLQVSAALEHLEPQTAEQRALELHVARWERFHARWHGRRHVVAAMTAEMPLWEARKASVSIDDPRQLNWFVRLGPLERMDLVKEEQDRRAGERRFQLAKRAMRMVG